MTTVRVDMIARPPGTSEVWLVVTDLRDWTDIPAHLAYLQERINEYIAVAHSPALRRHPMVRDIRKPEIWVAVFCLHEPPEVARTDLAEIDRSLREFGVRFRYEYFPLAMQRTPISC